MHSPHELNWLGRSGQDTAHLIVRKEEDMGNVVRIGALIPALLLLVAGCATKDWVRGYLGPKEAEIDQRFIQVEGRVGEEAQRIDKVQVRIGEEAQQIEGMGVRVKTLETSVGEVGEVAKAARERADTALTRADEVNSRLTRLWGSRHKRSPIESAEVQFGFDRWDLNDAAQTALVSLIKELKENDKLSVELAGYTDPTGAREYNIQLSQRRVEAVRRFLVEQGVELSRIHSVGLGPIPDREIPKEKKRRVTLKVTTFE
jgi:outer membrane protein OmpA-like peptidoglycan-associated protein